jgi:CxxC motif-containing protein (DUF1111 family)
LAHGDGLGPVFNARSCAACHFQGGVGGGGGIEHNAVSYEVFPREFDLNFHSGSIHNFSVKADQRETEEGIRAAFPIIPGRTETRGSQGCLSTVVIPDFDPLRTLSVQPTALFGAGWLDLVSDQAILRNFRTRSIKNVSHELSLKFDDIPIGRARVVEGGVGKFGWKSQFATLEEFVAAACANELGLGTPSTQQATPFGSEPQSPVKDLDRQQFRALVAFVKTLPKPVEMLPENPTDRDAAVHGKELFKTLGCAVCHVPDMGSVKGIYTDFLMYTLEDPPPPGGGTNYGEPPTEFRFASRGENEPRITEWKTPALWGVADSAPYLHDGSAPTLRDAILKHHGDGKSVMERFKELSLTDQNHLLAFLDTLKAPPTAQKLRNPSATKLSDK